MAFPEHTESASYSLPSNTELIATLTEINRQLELVDECENPIERLSERDSLLEKQDLLENEIASSSRSEVGLVDS